MQTNTTKKLAMLFITAVMTLGSGAALAASDTASGGSDSNNGQANQSGSAGAKENLPPNKVDNSKINTGSTDTSNMSTEDIHKNTMCKDGRCPDTNEKVQTGSGGDSGSTKTDGTTN